MYPINKPTSALSRREKDDRELGRSQEKMPNDKYEQRIDYEDGSCTIVWGGPCGSTNYDKYGEEC